MYIPKDVVTIKQPKQTIVQIRFVPNVKVSLTDVTAVKVRSLSKSVLLSVTLAAAAPVEYHIKSLHDWRLQHPSKHIMLK